MRTTRRFGSICSVFGAGLFSAVGSLQAASAQQATQQDVTTEQNVLQEVTVTAQRRSEGVQSVPISIVALSGKTLQDYGITDSNDLAKVTANVQIALPQGVGNQPAITIRGIGINDFDSNNAGSAGVYLDEFYLSSPTAQSFGLYDLERVEILKGPQGTLYGRNSSSGAINYITAKPQDQFGGYVLADAGNYHSARVEAAVTGPILPGVDGRLSFMRNYSEGYFENLGTGERQNGANDINWRGQLLFKPTDDLKILVQGNYGHVDRLPDAYRHLGAFVAGTQGNASPTPCPVAETLAGSPNCVDLYGQGTAQGFYQVYGRRTEHLKVTDYGGTVRVDWNPGPIDFVSLTGYHFNQRFLPEDTAVEPYRMLLVNYFNRSDEVSQEFRIGQIRDRYNWVSGLYYLHEHLLQDQPIGLFQDGDLFPEFGNPAGPGEADGIASMQNTNNVQRTDAYAAFGQGEYKFTDTLSGVLGGRVTHDDRSFVNFSDIQYQQGGINNYGPPQLIIDTKKFLNNSAFNYRLGLNYTPTRTTLIYGSIATGFKSGDFNGSFLATDPAVAAAQSQPAPPEKVTTYEIGTKNDLWDRRLRVNVALFYNDYRQMQIFAQVNAPINGMYEVINTLTSADKARTYGADIDLTARPIDNLTLNAQFGLLNSRVTRFSGPSSSTYQGKRLVFAPDFSTFLVADYRIPLGNSALHVQANGTYKSKQNLDSTGDPYQIQPGYWLAGAKLMYEIGQFEIGFYGNNLTNTHYATTTFDAVLPFGFDEIVIGKPRMYGVEAKMTF
jgi:iron complex outermembrane receptor protein